MSFHIPFAIIWSALLTSDVPRKHADAKRGGAFLDDLSGLTVPENASEPLYSGNVTTVQAKPD